MSVGFVKTIIDAIAASGKKNTEEEIRQAVVNDDTRFKGADVGKIAHLAGVITQWGGYQDEILLKAAADPAALNVATCLTPVLPSGATVWKAFLVMKFREIYCAAANYVGTLGYAQVQKVTSGSWISGITIATGALDVAAGASAAGDVLIGNIDVSAQVANDSEVEFQLVTLRSNVDDLALRDIQLGLQIYYTL